MQYDAIHGRGSGHHRHNIAYRGRRSLIRHLRARAQGVKLMLSDLQGVGRSSSPNRLRNYRVPMPTARTHPSEVLREKFLAPRRMDDRALADAIDLPVKHIREIVRGKAQAMTAGIASKLARCFQDYARVSPA